MLAVGLTSFKSRSCACCPATFGGVWPRQSPAVGPAPPLLSAICTYSPATTDAIDPAIQQLESEARSALQLPPDAALLWNRLRDELVCMAAEGQLPDAAETHQALVKRIDYVTTRRGVGVS
jgi:hypothetical protein